jgi:hypothetical protein
MAKSTGLVVAAAGIALANEAIFIPMETGKSPIQTINWRIIPAAAVLALVLAGLEKVSEPLGAGLAGLTLLAVLIVPVGNAPTPLENAGKVFGGIGGKK